MYICKFLKKTTTAERSRGVRPSLYFASCVIFRSRVLRVYMASCQGIHTVRLRSLRKARSEAVYIVGGKNHTNGTPKKGRSEKRSTKGRDFRTILPLYWSSSIHLVSVYPPAPSRKRIVECRDFFYPSLLKHMYFVCS